NEMAAIISHLRANVKGIENVCISVHCHNDLGLAVANSLSAAKAGANQIECTVNGIGERAGNAPVEEIAMALKTRGDIWNMTSNIDTTKIYRISKLVSSIVGIRLAPNKPVVGANAFVHESGIHQHGILQDKATYEIMNPADIGVPEETLLLGKHSGKHAFKNTTDEMGYALTDSQIDTFFPKFKELAERKKDISRVDIEALLFGETRRTVKRLYSLKDYEIVTYKNSASALVTLETDGKTLSERMTGDGPVDAAFKAISSIVGQNYKLQDYQVHAVTEGKDALGEATVKLSDGQNLMTGKGISTDVLEASLSAYINAINKILTA
ncbi:MAG: alpha-isopropylmalate synthase regulatory domain-containing protein, partial [Clostridia bacterium]